MILCKKSKLHVLWPSSFREKRISIERFKKFSMLLWPHTVLMKKRRFGITSYILLQKFSLHSKKKTFCITFNEKFYRSEVAFEFWWFFIIFRYFLKILDLFFCKTLSYFLTQNRNDSFHKKNRTTKNTLKNKKVLHF